MVKKVGLSLNKDVFKIICEFASLNECSPTEFCRLIIEHQVEFYLSTKKVPVFKLQPKLFFMNISNNSVEDPSDVQSEEVSVEDAKAICRNYVADLSKDDFKETVSDDDTLPF